MAYASDPIGKAIAHRLAVDLDEGFSELVTTYESTIYTLLYRTLGRQAEASDLAAETFLRAYKALRSYGPERRRHLAIRGWLVTIALNLARNAIRDRARRPLEVSLTVLGERAANDCVADEVISRIADGTRLATALLELSPVQRSAVVLRYVVGCSTDEVAAALRCGKSTARSHVSRGLDSLRHLLGEAQGVATNKTKVTKQ